MIFFFPVNCWYVDTIYNFQKVLSQILFTYVFSLPAGMRKGGGEREEEEQEVFSSCFLILLFLLILNVKIIWSLSQKRGLRWYYLDVYVPCVVFGVWFLWKNNPSYSLVLESPSHDMCLICLKFQLPFMLVPSTLPTYFSVLLSGRCSKSSFVRWY